ncbi:beta strand repeat-containing protein [Verrucomicrobiota bacterium sgz303538]
MTSRSRRKAIRPLGFAPRLAAAVALTLAGNAHGAVWSGNNSANWSTGMNWVEGTAPLGGDFLFFGSVGSAGPVLNNDLAADFLVSGITFDATAAPFTFNGNAIALAGPVANNGTSLQTINLPISLSVTQTFTTTAGGGDIQLNGVISGSGGISKLGTGTLTLGNTANTYTGETIFGPGIVNVASLSNYGVASSIGGRTAAMENNTVTGISLHFRGGTLQYTGSTPQSTDRQIRILGGGAAPGVNNTIDASGSTPEATLSFTHTGANINLFDTAGHRTLTLAGTNEGKNSFAIRLTDQNASTGLTNLAKAGTGTWYITNSDNTYTGETIIKGGILNVASVSDYGVASSIGSRTLAQENTTVTGVSLHFQGGTLQYTGSTPQSTNRNIRILNGNGATIDASGSTPDATLSFTHTGTNMNLFDTGGVRTLTLTGTNTGNNGFSIQLINQATSPTHLLKSGTGTWVLNGPDSNTSTGTTTVTGGTLVLNKTGAVAVNGPLIIGDFTGRDVVVIGGTGGNQIADTSTVTFNGAGSDAGILRLNNNNETIAGLISGGQDGIVENESGSAGTATLTVNVADIQMFAGVLRDGDGVGVDGKLALTKTGGGTLILAGASTHTGATTVSAGTLTVDGSLGAGSAVSITNATVNGLGTIAGPVTVGNNGVLSSTGTISGAVTVDTGGLLSGAGTITGVVTAANGARISAGGSAGVGALTISTLNLGSGSLLDFELGASSDLIRVTNVGGLALDGGAFNLYEVGGTTPLSTNGTYTLLDYNASFTGALSNLSIANSQAGKFYNLVDDKTNTVIKLTVADATVSEWNGSAANGQWTTSGNWTGATPNSAGTVAKFGSLPTSPTTVAVNGAKTVGSILFDNANSYTVNGGAADIVTLNNGVAAASLTVNNGSHTLAAPISLATSANATTATGTTLTISGNISGAKSFIASGSGTTILTGTNSYASTFVSGGTLQIGNGGTTGTLGTGDVTVDAGGALVFNRSDSFTVANNILGAGAQVTKLGAGTMTLTGTNTFSTSDGSGFNINAGTVKLGGPNALSSGVVLGFNGGTLDLNGNNLTTRYLTGGSGRLTDEGPGSGTTTITVDQTSTTTFAGTITDGAGRAIALTKSGTGTLTLTGANTFTGAVNIKNGAIIAAGEGGNIPIVSNITLGDGTNSVFLNVGASGQQFGAGTVVNFNNDGKNAKFQLRGSNQTVAGLDSTANPSVSLSIIQNDEANSPGYLGTPGPATLTINTTSDHSFAGLIRNNLGGGLNLVKEGPATQEIRNILVQTSAFTSATVNAGKLVFNYTVNANNTNTFGAGTSFVVNAGGTLVFDGTLVVPATSGGISGDGTIVKQGTGTVQISSANTFTKGIILNSGTLEIGNDQALGAPTGVITINGGSIRAASATREVPNPVLVNASFTIGRQTNLNGNLTLTTDATITANNPDGAANNTSALGPIGGNFRVTFAQGAAGIGTGAIVINGQNTNGGGTTVTSGRVNVSPSGSLANAALAVNGGELNFNSTAQTITGLSGSGGTINLGFGHTLTVNQQGNSTFAGVLGGGGDLVKSGAGTLTLGGASPSFFGASRVTEGTLLVNGRISGDVSVTGATSVLGGIGTVGLVTVQNGGSLAPGSGAAGMLNTLSLSMATGTKLSLEINNNAPGTGYDQLNVLGSVDLGGSTLSLLGTFLMSLGAPNVPFFVLLNDDVDAITGTFNGIPEGGHVLSSSGQDFILTYKADSLTNSFTGGNDVALLAVPEPSATVSLIGGLGVLLGMRRRRKA